MDNWLEVVKDNNILKMSHPASYEEIENAEKRLGLSFATDYKSLLLNIGACMCFGHEINGLTDNINLDVVIATEQARDKLELLPHSWYVIEDTHFDGILIMQDRNGTIYQMGPDKSPEKLKVSLEEYIAVSEGIPQIEMADVLSNENQVDEVKLENAAQTILTSNFSKARKKLEKPDQVEKVLQKMEKTMEKIPGIGDWIADVPGIISLVRSYIRKEYQEIPVSSIIAALAAVIYVVSPIDLIPDFIPGVGLLDDAAVFAVCWKMIHDDVDKYQAWRKQTGKEMV